MPFDKSLNPLDLDALESTAAAQADRIEPELGEVVVALHVDMRWLIAVTSIEEEAIREITEYIEIFYNRQRRQKRLGYLSPVAYEQLFYLRRMAA